MKSLVPLYTDYEVHTVKGTLDMSGHINQEQTERCETLSRS